MIHCLTLLKSNFGNTSSTSRRIDCVTNTILQKTDTPERKIKLENLMALITRDSRALLHPKCSFYLLHKLSGSHSLPNFNIPLDTANLLNQKSLVSMKNN